MNVASAKGTLRRASLFPNETVAGAFFLSSRLPRVCVFAGRKYCSGSILATPLLCGDKTRFGDMQYFWPRRYIK
jgi:hypothetical protein